MKQLEVILADQHFILNHDRTALWKEENALLLADLHVGKASHFRKHGIPLSSDHMLMDLSALETSIKRLNPSRLYILGDLHHSDHNEENKLVDDWLTGLKQEVILIEGNHDIHSSKHHQIPAIAHLKKHDILLCHQPLDKAKSFQINGHFHPGFRIAGKGRQSLMLPCFYISPEQMILPAFGSLTGSMNMKKRTRDQIVLISPDGLHAI